MIKNVPNKYSQRALLDVVDIHHSGKYDFFYLPIDFRNKCNLGYAFLNFTRPIYIVDFVLEFAGKRWDRYNSEKVRRSVAAIASSRTIPSHECDMTGSDLQVCEVCYGRIQGRQRLIEHFRSSRLMRKKDKYRPLLFDTVRPPPRPTPPHHHPHPCPGRSFGPEPFPGAGRRVLRGCNSALGPRPTRARPAGLTASKRQHENEMKEERSNGEKREIEMLPMPQWACGVGPSPCEGVKWTERACSVLA